ncbi:hypothetical protein JXB41_07680 [Candidatus Woesearchaeota archaeon]|nr:hypothetical protein [Candidatus Woesearchaeota archaeon]
MNLLNNLEEKIKDSFNEFVSKINPLYLACASGTGIGFYFWGTDFSFCFENIHIPIVNGDIDRFSWYAVNSIILLGAYAGMIISGLYNGSKKNHGSKIKAYAISCASALVGILSYATITSSLISQHTGELSGIAKAVSYFDPLFNKIGLAMANPFDIWNLCVIPIIAAGIGLCYGISELRAYYKSKSSST